MLWGSRWRRRLGAIARLERGQFAANERRQSYLSGFERKPVDGMGVGLARGRKQHHAAGAAVVILGYGLAEDVAVAGSSIAWAAWSRGVGRMKAIVTVRLQLYQRTTSASFRTMGVYLGQQAT